MSGPDRIRELLAINHAIAGASDRDEVLRLVVSRTAEFTGAEACLLLLSEGGERAAIAAASGLGAALVGERGLPLDEDLAVALREALGVGPDARFGGVPVVGPGGMAGILAVLDGRPGAEGFGEDEWLLSALADQAAIALENADRLRRLEAAVEATRAERRELAQVMEAAPISLVLVEGDEARIAYANRRALELLPTFAGSAPGDWWRRLRRPDGSPCTPDTCPLARALRAGEQVRGVELLLESPGEQERLLEFSASPLAPGAAGCKRAVIAIQDVSVREHLRREQAHATALADANRVKDLFFNTLSHELRTPLAAIRNAVELLRRGAADPGRRSRACAIIERSVGNQTRLICDLLDLSRIMLGRLRLEQDAVDLAVLVAEQVDALEQDARRKGLEMRLEPSCGPLFVCGDRDRLGQVVSNLLTNAVRYTERGLITVAAFAEAGQAVVRVRDTGVGIAAELLAHLFQPFRPADTSFERSAGGLGIGLSIAHTLVERHEGVLEVQSDGPGQGSLFTVRLPLANPARPAVEEARTPAAPPPGGRRVLIVEDNEDLRESLAELLRDWGHQVETASDGASAIAVAESHGFEIAFVDIGLPDINGFEIARRLRCATATARLVALTGFVSEAQKELARGAGFDEFVAKPVDLRSLEESLARLEPPA